MTLLQMPSHLILLLKSKFEGQCTKFVRSLSSDCHTFVCLHCFSQLGGVSTWNICIVIVGGILEADNRSLPTFMNSVMLVRYGFYVSHKLQSGVI